MSLAEGVQARVAYKAYSTGVITANTEATSSSDPGASGGQVLRRVSCSLNLKKNTYKSNEVLTTRQLLDFRHGPRRVEGSISGELSPGTYFDLIEAAMRGTKSASLITATQTDFTSVSGSGGNFVFAGGNPHSKGFRVGDVIRFTSLSDTTMNSINYTITSFSASNNRTMGVYPAANVMTADSSFSMTTVGKSIYVPTSSHVSRKFGVEVYHSDLDLHRFFTECRVSGFTLNIPATGPVTIEVPMTGRDMETASGASSPFYTAPTAATTSGICAAVNGLLQVGGVTQGVVTSAQVKFDMAVTADPVVGQYFVPEIFLGMVNVTGQLTVMFQDLTMLNYFVNETESSALLYIPNSSSSASDAVTLFLPRLKFGDANVAVSGEGAQIVTMPFQAIQYATAGTGIEATTIRITDTLAS